MTRSAGQQEAQPREFRSLAQLYSALQNEEQESPAGFAEHVVPGEGPIGAPLMLVGEQPGDQEDIARVGPGLAAGK